MPNMMTQAGRNLNQAIGGTKDVMNAQPQTIAGANLSQYQNPFQQQVIDRTMTNMDRARQMTQNNIGAQATSQGAFGGSRHGLVEAENNRNFANASADMAARMNMQGFNNAQQMAQNDINNNLAYGNQSLNAANQVGSLAGQQFSQGSALNNALQQAGQQVQNINQGLINQGRQDFNSWSNSPTTSMNPLLAAIGATPSVGTSHTSNNPGLFGMIGGLTSVLPFL